MFCNTDSSSASVCAPSNFIYMNDPIWLNKITHMQKVSSEAIRHLKFLRKMR